MANKHRDRKGHDKMCRSIRRLRLPDQTATESDVRAAALQFVRKVSGFNAPSQPNRAAFERAVEEISAATLALLEALPAARASRIHEAASSMNMAVRPDGG